MNGWRKSTLGEVLSTIRNGINCQQNKQGAGDRISRIETIADGSVDLLRVGYANLSESDKQKYRLLRGDILFSHINSAPHIGKTALLNADDELYHGVNLLLLRPRSSVTASFLKYYLEYLHVRGHWKNICKQSVNQASINQQDICREPIAYPDSVREQQRIVAILDKAFASIAIAKANIEKNIENARELFDSAVEAAIGGELQWPKRQLGELCTIGDGNHSSNYPKKAEMVASGVPFIRASNLSDGKISADDMRFISPAKHAALKKGHLKEGDILFSNRGDIGKLAYVDKAYDNANLNSQLAWLRCRNEISAPFLFYALSSKTLQEQMGNETTGAALQQLTIRQLSALRVPCPTLDVQADVATRLARLDSSIGELTSALTEKLQKLPKLMSSLLHAAFNGEL